MALRAGLQEPKQKIVADARRFRTIVAMIPMFSARDRRCGQSICDKGQKDVHGLFSA